MYSSDSRQKLCSSKGLNLASLGGTMTGANIVRDFSLCQSVFLSRLRRRDKANFLPSSQASFSPVERSKLGNGKIKALKL